MPDKKMLNEAKTVNLLPANRHARKLLKLVKEPVEEYQVHCVQLLNWAIDKGKLNPVERLKPMILMMDIRSSSPFWVVKMLDLKTISKLEDPVEMARELLEIIDGKLMEQGMT